MWKHKQQSKHSNKRARESSSTTAADNDGLHSYKPTTGASGVAIDDDEGEEEGEAGGDGFRVKYADQHMGCIPLETLKSLPEYADRIETNPANPKKKYAVCFGYLGSAYQGLQINPGALTVESVLLKALYLCGGIEECNYENPQKLGWTRAARTDRGVHAISQMCAMKLLIANRGEEAFRGLVNRYLPSDIRVFELKRVTKSFNSKISCSGRRYQYLLPTYLFTDADTTREVLNSAAGKTKEERLEAARGRLLSYRLTPEAMTRLRDTLHSFEGTKKYHNFTFMKHPSETSALRYITSFTATDPTVLGSDGIEWVCLSVVGQSFLLNQIRKMVALVIEVVRGAAPLRVLDEAFDVDNKVDILMAPGLGLYLDKLFFEVYNRRLVTNTTNSRQKQASKAKGAADADDEDESSGRLEFDIEGSETAVSMEAFKSGVVWDHIVSQEKSSLQFIEYLDELNTLKSDYAVKPFPPPGKMR